MRSTVKPVNPIGTSYKSPKWHSFLNASNITVAQAYVPSRSRFEAYTFTFDIIANGSAQQSPDNATQLDAGTDLEGDLEGNLDAGTLIAIDYPTPLIAFTTGGSPPSTPPPPPQPTPTSPTSPGSTTSSRNPTSRKQSPPPTAMTSKPSPTPTPPACQQFAQLGARGITMLFAPGDPGVGPTGVWLSNDGKNTTMFLPSFPASCPYVTTVGATKTFAPEVAAFDPANSFASGGVQQLFPPPRVPGLVCAGLHCQPRESVSRAV
ncbi:MAG: tripeptidyl peptidase [Lasallia pustulata]|uniref:Tripeptidyl peptidase n=1 Tax=Lasallia pustulata TaxID=136370 RepID=A0A5M8Q2M5_9LECA|nr:MAG: tripeptidyl peptidase [Lasallia pustulata]